MTNSESCASRVVLGVDGGGTKTSFRLVQISSGTPGGVTLAESTTGPSNPHVAGLAAAVHELERGLQLLRDSISQFPAIDLACFALSGAARSAEREALQSWASAQKFAARCHFVHDALPLLEFGNSRGVGIALIAGTGSMAWGRTPAGESLRAGGLGAVLGDEGSAYWLGLQAVRQLAKSMDRGEPLTELMLQIQRQLSVSSLVELVPLSLQLSKPQIAALAPCVCQAADTDRFAGAALIAAAQALSELVLAVRDRAADWPSPLCLPLAGGLFGSRLLRELLRQQLDALTGSFEIVHVTDPLDAVIRFAARLVNDAVADSAGT